MSLKRRIKKLEEKNGDGPLKVTVRWLLDTDPEPEREPGTIVVSWDDIEPERK